MSVGGTYYLPYQAHATSEQFREAYPGARSLFELKQRLDPDFRFRNILWDRYYQPSKEAAMSSSTSEFKTVYGNESLKDAFYRFLQVVFHLYPEDKFHDLIAVTSDEKNSDEDIYKTLQDKLPSIEPFLAIVRLGLPALKKQKREMARQTLELLGNTTSFDGYIEIGSTGRYISEIQKHVQVDGDIFIINDIAPDNSIGEIFERGQIGKLGSFIHLNEYTPIDEDTILSESIELITCFIGLHHCRPEKLTGFLESIHRVLKPEGKFIIRDHNVLTEEMDVFCALVHTVFNVGTNESWETNANEFRDFKSIDEWSRIVCEIGFSDSGQRLLQDNDPSDNTLVMYTKV